MELGEDINPQRHVKKLMHNRNIKYQIMNHFFPNEYEPSHPGKTAETLNIMMLRNKSV